MGPSRWILLTAALAATPSAAPAAAQACATSCGSACSPLKACETACQVGVLSNAGATCATVTCGAAGAPCCDRAQALCCEGDLLSQALVRDPLRPNEYIRFPDGACLVIVHPLLESTYCGGRVERAPAPDRFVLYPPIPTNGGDPCDDQGEPDEDPD